MVRVVPKRRKLMVEVRVVSRFAAGITISIVWMLTIEAGFRFRLHSRLPQMATYIPGLPSPSAIALGQTTFLTRLFAELVPFRQILIGDMILFWH